MRLFPLENAARKTIKSNAINELAPRCCPGAKNLPPTPIEKCGSDPIKSFIISKTMRKR
jgi:hypothetical protein